MNMKKIVSVFLLIALVSLCGCSAITSSILEADSIETLKGWTFQYNEGTNDYSLFFGLLNEKDEFIAAEVDVDIRIEDESGNELYRSTRSVSKRDFGNYSSQVSREQFLANVRIKASDIMEGTSTSGTVYLKVYKENIVQFDEVNCKALYCLPTKGVTLPPAICPHPGRRCSAPSPRDTDNTCRTRRSHTRGIRRPGREAGSDR